jgi:hypothetical protein
MKRAQQPSKVYASLKPQSRNNVRGNHEMTVQEMFDLSDVISKVKKELPHTKPRLRK